MTTNRVRAAWRAARRAVSALRAIQDEQVRMWEVWWQANRASGPEAGPLTWVLTLDGNRLAGSHLPPTATPRAAIPPKEGSSSCPTRK